MSSAGHSQTRAECYHYGHFIDLGYFMFAILEDAQQKTASIGAVAVLVKQSHGKAARKFSVT
jgi:hypothetical protein